MGKFKIILFIFTFVFILSGCNRVIITSADEVVSCCWQAKNPSGISTELKFEAETNTAELIIKENKKTTEISGTFAIDSENLIIVSENPPKTYQFEYRVYENRMELTYMNETLVLTKNKPQ